MSTAELTITIPTDVGEALRIPPRLRKQRVQQELAVHLYEEQLLSLGKAAELCGLDRRAFSTLLGARGIVRHYSEEDLEEDIHFAEHEAHE